MNKKLWNNKTSNISEEITSFLAGEDIELDKFIFIYDIDASLGHVKALQSIGIIKKNELTKLTKALKILRKNFIEGSFKLTNKYEDCHSAIEFYLTKELGDLGKKVGESISEVLPGEFVSDCCELIDSPLGCGFAFKEFVEILGKLGFAPTCWQVGELGNFLEGAEGCEG